MADQISSCYSAFRRRLCEEACIKDKEEVVVHIVERRASGFSAQWGECCI